MFEIWDKALKNPKFTTEYIYKNNHFYLSHADCASIRRLSQSNSKSGARISLIKKKKKKKLQNVATRTSTCDSFHKQKAKKRSLLIKILKVTFEWVVMSRSCQDIL